MPRSQYSSNEYRQYAFDFSRSGTVQYETAFESADGLVMRYGLEDSDINQHLGALLRPECADLIDIAVAAHIGDRLGIRGGKEQQSMWRRAMNISVQVRRPTVWARPEVQGALVEALEYLTEDDWHFRFSPRLSSPPRLAESQQHLFPGLFDGNVRVSLLSGGLDSFVGTAAAIAREPGSHYVCVSGVANNRHGDRQTKQVKELRRLKPSSLTHIRVACWLKHADEVPQEPTRRTRGFLFLALGAAAAIAVGVDNLWVYENGVGAINLPFIPFELGATTSRSVHPRTLVLMSELLSKLTEQEFTVHNGAVLQTKAQMCSDPSIRAVLDAIPLTFSCDAFPLRQRGPTQCGVCTSCVLRRQSLCGAGLQRYDDHQYRYDLCGSVDRLSERQLRGVREMSWQVERLARGMEQESSWLGLVSEFPSIASAQRALAQQLGLSETVVADRLVALFQRHCEEWSRFPGAACGQTFGRAA